MDVEKQIKNIKLRLDKIEDDISQLQNKELGYNPKRAFAMPPVPFNEKGKTMAIVDLPNIINTCLNEKALLHAKDEAFFDPNFLKILLEKYILIYEPNIQYIHIYTTPDYEQVNKYISDTFADRPFVCLFVSDEYDKELHKWRDIDNPIKSFLRALYNNLSVRDRHVARVLLLSGDGDYYQEIKSLVERKIHIYVIGHYIGYSMTYKDLVSVNEPKTSKNDNELWFTYRFYKNTEVEKEMN